MFCIIIITSAGVYFGVFILIIPLGPATFYCRKYQQKGRVHEVPECILQGGMFAMQFS